MAKKESEPVPTVSQTSDPLESRAWELFASSTIIGSTATMTSESRAEECFKEAAAFQAVAEKRAQPQG